MNIPKEVQSGLRLLVSVRFQDLFHSPPGVLFTFPSRYWFTIGYQGVFSLGSGSSLLPAGFLVSRRTLGTHRTFRVFGYRIFTFSDGPFQTASPNPSTALGVSFNPAGLSLRFGLLPFRSPLLGKSRFCFLFLRVLRCFSSPGLPSLTLCVQVRIPSVFGWRV